MRPTNRILLSRLALVVPAVGGLALSPTSSPAAAQSASGYQALTPARIVDTRNGVGATGPVGPGGTIDVKVTGTGGVPANGVGAVVLNVTATNPTAATFVTVWPTGQVRPTASNLNVVAGQSVPNLVIATVGAEGRVSLYNYAGNVDLLADVTGWFPTGAAFSGLTPSRIVDSRSGLGATGPVGAGGQINIKVTGVGGVPDSGVGAVVLNLTATNPTDATFVTAWPTGQPRPTASNLNVVAGQSVPNLVIATVGTDGKVSLYNYAGTVDLLADVAGWFPAGASSGAAYSGLVPSRVLDTRVGLGATGPVAAGGQVDVKVTGAGGVPASGVGAVVLNVTATNPTDATFITAWPTGQPRPTASNLNVVAGQSVPNLVIATVGAGGNVSLYNYAGGTDLLADVIGWFPGTTPPPAGLAGDLYFSELVGLNRYRFATQLETTAYDGYEDSGFAVNPAGTEFVYGIDQFPSTEIFVHNLATGTVNTSFVVNESLAPLDSIHPSPDGNLFALMVNDYDDILGPDDVMIVDRAGTPVARYSTVKSVTWTPDGRLVTVAESSSGSYVMAVISNLTTGAGFVVTTYNNLFDDLPVDLAGAPNGTEVAYKYLGQLWVQPLDGSPARQLTEGNVAIEGAVFSPDSQSLAVRRDDGRWCYGSIHLLPNLQGAPINVAAEGPTLVRTNDGVPVSACYQLYWLP